MTHLSPAATGRRAVTPRLLSPDASPPLIGNRTRLRDALAQKRAAVAALEARWVTASERDAARETNRHVRMDNRSTWDKATWSRYLAAAAAHEPDFMPQIARLLREIDSIETLLAMPEHPRAHAVAVFDD